MAHNDIFLEAFELIDLTQSSGIREDPRRFLKGSSRNEAVRLERSLGDSQKDRFPFGRLSAFFGNEIVRIHKSETVDLVAPKEIRVTGIGNANLEKHSRYDHLKVLVANGYALQAIDFLNFFNEVLLNGGRPENF